MDSLLSSLKRPGELWAMMSAKLLRFANKIEDSLPLAPELPLVSPFLCFDDSKTDSKVTSKPSSPSGSSSYDTFAPSSEFPIAPVDAPPEIVEWPSDSYLTGVAILAVGPLPPPIINGW
ncbi:hypothetical protein Tco_1408028 [Tanacetum coccineum]